jgi:xanthine dehydrogenase accessory factor
MWIERLHAWIEQGLPCVLVTVTDAAGSTPRPAGAKLVVNLEGAVAGSVGGGFIEHRCLEEARRILATGTPCTLHFRLDAADWQESAAKEGGTVGSVAVFLEPVFPPREVVAFGGGHIAERLAGLCAVVGLPFRVYDERPGFANRERFPGAREVVCAPYGELGRHLRLSPASHCVVATHGHAQDECVLEQLLQVPDLPYLGLVGSARKLQGIRERLAAKGFVLGSQVHSPAGLALGGSLPGDIALAILAEIKLQMDGGRLEHLGRAD